MTIFIINAIIIAILVTLVIRNKELDVAAETMSLMEKRHVFFGYLIALTTALVTVGCLLTIPITQWSWLENVTQVTESAGGWATYNTLLVIVALALFIVILPGIVVAYNMKIRAKTLGASTLRKLLVVLIPPILLVALGGNVATALGVLFITVMLQLILTWAYNQVKDTMSDEEAAIYATGEAAMTETATLLWLVSGLITVFMVGLLI